MAVDGIDVSDYQSQTPDLSGKSFIFIKATEGRSYINPDQEEQAAHGRAHGALVGFYHFLWPGNIDDQAEYFVEKCASREGDVFAVDWETTGSGTRATCAEKDAFIKAVKKLRPTHRVILYCNRDFWLNHDTTSYAGDGLWIADYVTAGKPRIKAKWLFHQYTSKPIDTNVGAFTDAAALRSWARALIKGDDKPADDKPAGGKPPYTPPAFPKGLAPNKARPSAVGLQRALKAGGFMAKTVPESPNYGPKTQAGVIAFHNAHPQYRAKGVAKDPAIGPKGWATLHRLAYDK